MRLRALIALPMLLAFSACDDGTGGTDGTDSLPDFDEGCILVDGGGGYAYLADAMTVAESGSTIDLCFDVTVSLQLDQVLTIKGNGFNLVPPVNESALTVLEGGDITLDNVVVQTTRSGFIVQTGGKLTVTNVDLGTPPNYGIDVQSGAEVYAEGLTMNAPEWGGVKVSGGTLTLKGSTITSPGSYGVYVENDGVATIEDNVFEGARNKDTEAGLFDLDGVAVWGESGATINMAGNEIIGPDVVGVSVEDGTLTMDGDTITGSAVGVGIRNSKATLTGVTDDVFGVYGFLAINSAEVTLDSVSFVTDPEVARQPTLDDSGSVALYGIESSIVVTGTADNPSRFEGANGAGVIMSPSGGGGVLARIEMSDSIIANNGAFGMAIYQDEAILNNVEILDTRNNDEVCAGDGGQRCNMALALWSANASITGGAVRGSEGWGITVVTGSVDLVDTVIADNEQYAVFSQTGSITAKGASFEDGRAYQIYAHTDSTVVLDSVTFKNGDYTSEFENDTTRNITYYSARDIYVSDSDLIIKDSKFENGQYGVNVNGFSGGADVEITNTTFTGYNQQAMSIGTGSKWKVRNVVIDDIGNYGVYCYSGSVSLDNVIIKNVNEYKYKWEYFVDGELLYDSEYDSIGRGMYFSNCSVELEDVSLDGSKGQAFYAYNSSLEFDGFEVKNAMTEMAGSQPAVDVIWSRRTDADGVVEATSYPVAYINKLAVSGVDGATAMRIQGWQDPDTKAVAKGTVSLRDVVLGSVEEGGGIGGHGLEVNDIGDLQILGLDITGVAQNGLTLNRTDAVVTGADASRKGIIDSPGMTGIAVDATRRDAAPASVTLNKLTVNAAGLSGVTLDGGKHTVSDVSVSKATNYGMVCAVDTTFATCDATLDGVMGPHDGCDACDPPK